MTTLFISDLHLEPARPEISAALLQLLQGEARQAEALYILGDLFEAWIGDDVSAPDYGDSIAALKSLSDTGIPIYVQSGNRDFMLGRGFEQITGATLLSDEHIIEINGDRILLMHGDQLCTDDIDYQRWRRIYKNRVYRALFQLLPQFLRRKIGRSLRENLRSERFDKPPEITDVNQDAVVAALREFNTRQMIHGHTHRPAIHEFDLDGRTAKRIVLGDWYTQGSVLRWGEDGPDLQALPFAIIE